MIRVLINKFTFMKDSKQSFKDLVKKMDSLEETQQGKLKGGFSTMSAATLFGYSPDNNCYNNCDRGLYVFKLT
jgi:hypothetical protein